MGSIIFIFQPITVTVCVQYLDNPRRARARNAMMKLSKIGFLLAVLGVISGCSTMSADECATADWRTIGYEDGAAGLEASAISRHRKACAKHGVTANFDAYEAGRHEGLRQYCRPANGYKVGRKGTTYNGVCPRDMEDEFLAAYEDGYEHFRLQKAVQDIQRDIRRVDRDLVGAHAELETLEIDLVADGIDSTERSRILDETKYMSRVIGDLEHERDDLIYELGVREERLARYLNSRSD